MTAPARTQTARNETALLVPAGGTWNTDARPVTEPMRTRTTRETEGVVVVPMRNHNRPKTVREPFDTFAANGLHHALLMRNNTARGNPGQMCTPVPEPMRTLTTAGHQSLVWNPNLLLAYDTGKRPLDSVSRSRPRPPWRVTRSWMPGCRVEDCLFRMLTPEEIKLGMAFARDFVLLGTKREQVKLAGNAVTPPAARDLIAAVVEAITGDEVTAAWAAPTCRLLRGRPSCAWIGPFGASKEHTSNRSLDRSTMRAWLQAAPSGGWRQVGVGLRQSQS